MCVEYGFEKAEGEERSQEVSDAEGRPCSAIQRTFNHQAFRLNHVIGLVVVCLCCGFVTLFSPRHPPQNPGKEAPAKKPAAQNNPADQHESDNPLHPSTQTLARERHPKHTRKPQTGAGSRQHTRERILTPKPSRRKTQRSRE